MSNQRALRFGAIGLGRHMLRSLLPNLLASPDWVLVAAAELRPEVRVSFSERFSHVAVFETPEALFEESGRLRLDAVFIALSPSEHVRCTSLALTAGLHVFVEKPVAENAGDLADLVSTWRSTHQVVMVGTMWRYCQASTIFRNWCEHAPRDRLITNISIVATFPAVYTRDGWPAGELEVAFLDMFIHPIDYAVWILGPLQFVRTFISQTGVAGRLSACVVLKADGGIATLNLTTGSAAYGVEVAMQVSDGTCVRIEDFSSLSLNTEQTWTGTPGSIRDRPTFAWLQGPLYRGYARHGYAEEIAAFRSAILDGSPVLSNLKEAALTMSVVDAALHSYREDKDIRIDSCHDPVITAIPNGPVVPNYTPAFAALLRSSVVDCIRQTISVDEQDMLSDAQFGLTPGWDSVGHMNLMVALETKFGIELPFEDLPLLTSVTAVVDHLLKHGTEIHVGEASQRNDS